MRLFIAIGLAERAQSGNSRSHPNSNQSHAEPTDPPRTGV